MTIPVQTPKIFVFSDLHPAFLLPLVIALTRKPQMNFSFLQSRIAVWYYIKVVLDFIYLLFFRRHSELRSESDRKVASLEARLEATIRKYETQMHTLQTDNERLRSNTTPLTNGKIKLKLCLHYTG